MKIKLIVLFAALVLGAAGLKAQEKGNKNVVTQERSVSGFTGIVAGGALTLYLEQDPAFSVLVETDDNLQDNVTTELDGNKLVVKSSKIRNPTKLNVYVKLPELKYLQASGATDVYGKSTFETEEMQIIVSGATSVKLDINVAYLESTVSGAADLTLTGTANTHMLDVSGAGTLKASNLETKKATYAVSGAADADLYVTEEITGTKKGAADISYSGSPAKTSVSKVNSNDNGRYTVRSDNYYDSVKVRVGGIKVEVFDGDDSVKVIVGDREIHVDEDGNVRYWRSKKPRFNGHWAGFDMGLNGFVNSDFNQSFPKKYEYLDLRMTKSVAVHINFFEQNVAFSRNQKWGMVTGLGMNWNNYRFSKATRLSADSSQLEGFIDKGISVRKSKLTALYLSVPLIFEFQTNSRHKKNSFHLGAGMIASARLSSHTKKYYDERNKEFDVTQYNPESDQYETVFTATSPDYSKTKNFDDFYLQPFKFDATVRIGWGFINLFATYSVNEMFKKDKGPEVYPWTIGITFVNF
jgi:hypothetical protein